MKIDSPTLLKNIVGYALFACLASLLLALCVYVKSWWGEPLGFDGLVLWFVLMIPTRKAFPIIERLIEKPGITRSEHDER